ncbi:MAG: UbiD family decarboxylase domain-containing protein, partial [Candidatus Ranarchaeia archaeon]
MDFREYIAKLDKTGQLFKIKKEVSTDVEAAAVLKTAEPKPVLFENLKKFPNHRVAGNIFCTKDTIADYLGITTADLLPHLTKAIDTRSPREEINNPPCQEVVMDGVNLDTLPILRYNERDGGRYISSAVVIAKDPEFGQNLD